MVGWCYRRCTERRVKGDRLTQVQLEEEEEDDDDEEEEEAGGFPYR